ncbi:MAG: DUF5750 family protein [Methanobacterium sp.]
MKVKIIDYGLSKDSKYFVTYRIYDINQDWLTKLKNRVEDKMKIKDGELYITVYFQKDFFPFASDESSCRMEDFISREEIEMTAYLLGILED